MPPGAINTNAMTYYRKTIMTTQLYYYLKYYCDLDSETFGNAYRSALRAGYAPSTARVITTRYPRRQLKWLKHTATVMSSTFER